MKGNEMENVKLTRKQLERIASKGQKRGLSREQAASLLDLMGDDKFVEIIEGNGDSFVCAFGDDGCEFGIDVYGMVEND